MSKSFSLLQEPLKISVRPSFLLFFYLLVIHLVTLAGLLYTLQTSLLRLAAALTLALTFVYYTFHWLLGWGRNSVRHIHIHRDRVRLTLADGSRQYGHLGKQYFFSAHLIVLAIKIGDKGPERLVPLVYDAVDPATFRRLRVRLRYPLADAQVQKNFRVAK